jgi:hypothetical protein
VANEELWDTARCARFLGYSYDYFRKEVRYWEGVPKPVEKPGRDRWLSSDWVEWAAKSRNSYAKVA